MSRFTYALEIAAAGRSGGQDRATVTELGNDIMIVVADGAGGTGNGAVAAQAIVDAVCARAGETRDLAVLLAELDRDAVLLGHGQSTAVALVVGPGGIGGASVGDSGAWLVGDNEIVDLTEHQVRKPLVGAGCIPVAFDAGALDGGTLVVGTDGLFRYAKRDDIARLAREPDLAAAARALVDRVRLPTGGLQDDVAVVLCR
jgi:serine/threonine protein phosphatase PrpC